MLTVSGFSGFVGDAMLRGAFVGGESLALLGVASNAPPASPTRRAGCFSQRRNGVAPCEARRYAQTPTHCLMAERRKKTVVLGIGWHRIFLRSWFAELSGLESGAGRAQRVARARYLSIRQ